MVLSVLPEQSRLLEWSFFKYGQYSSSCKKCLCDVQNKKQDIISRDVLTRFFVTDSQQNTDPPVIAQISVVGVFSVTALSNHFDYSVHTTQCVKFLSYLGSLFADFADDGLLQTFCGLNIRGLMVNLLFFSLIFAVYPKIREILRLKNLAQKYDAAKIWGSKVLSVVSEQSGLLECLFKYG